MRIDAIEGQESLDELVGVNWKESRLITGAGDPQHGQSLCSFYSEHWQPSGGTGPSQCSKSLLGYWAIPPNIIVLDRICELPQSASSGSPA